MQPAIRIVERRIERARRDQLGQNRQGLGLLVQLRQVLGLVIELRRQMQHQIDRMPSEREPAGDRDDVFGKRPHCPVGLFGRHHLGRPGPHAPQGHASQPVSLLPLGFNADFHVDQRAFVHHSSAKLQRSAKRNRLETTGGVLDDDVGGFGHDPGAKRRRGTPVTITVTRPFPARPRLLPSDATDQPPNESRNSPEPVPETGRMTIPHVVCHWLRQCSSFVRELAQAETVAPDDSVVFNRLLDLAAWKTCPPPTGSRKR